MAGRLLGQGEFPGYDTRPGVGVRAGLPDFDWVRIPAGEFLYGRRKKKRKIKEDFWITRFPVTYAQFETFLRAEDGFKNPQWWKGLGADKDHRRTLGNQRFKYWNHPRERVSWYDAIAFSRWLTAKLEKYPELLPTDLREEPQKWKITLPTEWQWERARAVLMGVGIRGETNMKVDGPMWMNQELSKPPIIICRKPAP